jgi:hypothetical protein
MALSCICCLLSPLAFGFESSTAWIGFLVLWGLLVIADSPMFSTLVAQNAQPEVKGSALTIVNCIGFSITIVSIQLINFLKDSFELRYLFMVLAFGPVLGLMALTKKSRIA